MCPMNPRLLRPTASGAAFTPLALSGLVGWYDSSDLSRMAQNSDGSGAVAVGDQVGYWADKSGGGNHVTQGIAANRPTLTAAAVNGRAALVFDGSNDNLSRTSYTAQSGLAGLTRIAVFSTSQNSHLSRDVSGADVPFFVTGGQMVSRISGSAGTATAISPANQAALRVYASRYDGSGPTKELYFNNAIQTPEASAFVTTALTATTPAGPGTLHIGSNAAANNFINGPIAEYLVYNRALSAAELTAVYNWLKAKWGL
jgi:hypothetical protein